MPLRTPTPLLPNSCPNLTSRSIYRTFQTSTVRLVMAGETVSLITQASQGTTLCGTKHQMPRWPSHPGLSGPVLTYRAPGMRCLRGQSIQLSSLGNSSNYLSGPENSYFSSLQGWKVSKASILTPSCPLGPHRRGQTLVSSTQPLEQHLLSKTKTRVKD